MCVYFPIYKLITRWDESRSSLCVVAVAFLYVGVPEVLPTDSFVSGRLNFLFFGQVTICLRRW